MKHSEFVFYADRRLHSGTLSAADRAAIHQIVSRVQARYVGRTLFFYLPEFQAVPFYAIPDRGTYFCGAYEFPNLLNAFSYILEELHDAGATYAISNLIASRLAGQVTATVTQGHLYFTRGDNAAGLSYMTVNGGLTVGTSDLRAPIAELYSDESALDDLCAYVEATLKGN